MATDAPEPIALPSWDEPDESAGAPARMPYRLILAGVVGLIVLVAGYFAFRGGNGAAVGGREIKEKVTRGNLVIVVTEDGNVESSSNVDVKCEVAGGSTILWIVKDGTRVEEGDELVRLDSSSIEDQVNSQKIAYAKAQAAKIEAEKMFSSAKIAVQEFIEGNYVQQLQDSEGKITVAMENLRSAENSMQHTDRMARKGYVTSLQREAQAFAVEQAKINLASAHTARTVLEKFTKPKMLVDLESKRDTAEAKMRSEDAAFALETARLKRLQNLLEKCTINAPHSGMVVYANEAGGRPGQQTVLIEEGAGVRERQSIIRLPDLAPHAGQVHGPRVESRSIASRHAGPRSHPGSRLPGRGGDRGQSARAGQLAFGQREEVCHDRADRRQGPEPPPRHDRGCRDPGGRSEERAQRSG